MDPRWLLRMSRWARNPPSPKMVKLVLGLLAVLICIWLIERYIGWPDWATAERMRRPRF